MPSERRPNIHSLSAAAIDDVKIDAGEDRAIRIEIEMNNSAGIFQVDELLATKLRGSKLEDHVEVIARIDAEHEKRLVPIFRIWPGGARLVAEQALDLVPGQLDRVALVQAVERLVGEQIRRLVEDLPEAPAARAQLVLPQGAGPASAGATRTCQLDRHRRSRPQP